MCPKVCCLFYSFFCFKRKTAYELRISDWSSDVCSSDLVATDGGHYLSRFARSTGMGNKGNGRFQEAWRSVRCEPTITFMPLTPFVPALRTQPVIFFSF